VRRNKPTGRPSRADFAPLPAVQVAGNKNPFQVTIILACVQLISVLLTAAFSDGFGRRPLVLGGYAITVVSVLCLGIVGCFDYVKPALGSLLVGGFPNPTILLS